MFRRPITVPALIAGISAMVMAAVMTMVVSPAASGAPVEGPAASVQGNDAVQRVLDRAVSGRGAPGILAEVSAGNVPWFGTAGFADTATERKRQPFDRYRIGSATKTFTATVLLQLAGEGKLRLDDTVEKWLPGVVKGNGHDGSKITVRQLLNHTSGVFSYTNDPDMMARLVGQGFLDHRYDSMRPGELVALAMKHAPDFAPGTSWAYSNTNYILAGMIVERVSGRSLATEVNRRITSPLGLVNTYVPGESATINGPHARHYSKLLLTDPAAPVHDVTDMNTTSAGAAGNMISTSGDLNRFYSALLGGRLLPAAQQKEMFTTVPTKNWIPDTGYGLGVISQKLSCGVQVWGHVGTIHGSQSWTMGLRDGAKTVSTNVNGDWVDQVGISVDVMQAAFCPTARQAAATRSTIRPLQLL
ncbi:serine hydrolase domain-containing protein [Streptomyces monticola]|uniref:Serine hydrolase domain-containing protein n=1 Tax=Streptomyces monticola TaxID=2666263 RepID=A0ABW2JDG0_9ACTN